MYGGAGAATKIQTWLHSVLLNSGFTHLDGCCLLSPRHYPPGKNPEQRNE